MTAIAVALNASVVTGVALATYTGTATALTMVHDTLGSTGNTFSLATSVSPASSGTVSAATLTGGLNAHTFLSGTWTLPSMSIEVAMPEVPRFAMYSGCVLDALSWQMERSGLLGAKATLVAQGETIAGATAAGTPAAIVLKRFGHFNGAIKRDGVALGNIVSADVTYANNLDRIETIRSDAKIDGADPTIAALTGILGASLREPAWTGAAPGWTVDIATGIVNFLSPPSVGANLTSGFEFDVPVRFDTDDLPVTLDIERLGSITSIPLIEVRR